MHPALARFVDLMDRLVATEDDPYAIADATGHYLQDLLTEPEFLEDRFAQADPACYAQHVVHVHPEGRYSIVALVWLPGQRTAIHDHACWCVVGVLRGEEHETNYDLHGPDGAQWLAVRGEQTHPVGSVCCLVPPLNDIHRVQNSTDGLAISIHVYGTDIASRGTSIYTVYDCEVRPQRAQPIGS